MLGSSVVKIDHFCFHFQGLAVNDDFFKLFLMIGLVRLVGFMNAAVWFGAAIFFLCGAYPAVTSQEMNQLIGARNFPYFSVAISGIIAKSFSTLYLACSLVAIVHLLAEWLYLGRYPKRIWLGFVLGLCVVGIMQGFWFQPKLMELNRLHHAGQAQAENAGKAYQTWQRISTAFHWLAMAGLGLYLWRQANPSDTMRFVSASKFRG